MNTNGAFYPGPGPGDDGFLSLAKGSASSSASSAASGGGGGGNGTVVVEVNNATVGTQGTIDFISGQNVQLIGVNNGPANRVEVTVIAVGGGGGSGPWYGDGRDGNLTFDGTTVVLGITPANGTYTLNKNVYAVNLTVNANVTVLPSNFRLTGTGTLTVNGTISANGPNGTDGNASVSGSGATGGASGYYSGAGTGGSGAAGNGNVGTGPAFLGKTPVATIGGTGGTGSGGTNLGGAGGNTTANVVPALSGGSGVLRDPVTLLEGYCFSGSNGVITNVSFSGAGGGGGAGDGSNRGGGGGAGAGSIIGGFPTITGNGTLTAVGGNGGAGTVGNVGGGAGGAGGTIALITGATPPVSLTITAASGAGGAGHGTGTAGGTGTVGQVIYLLAGGGGGGSAGGGLSTEDSVITMITALDAPNSFAMSTLATGLVKNTTGTGVPTIAVDGTDYYGPGANFTIPVAQGGTGVQTIPTGILKGAAGALAVATANVDYATPAAIQKLQFNYQGTDSGSANTYALALTPSVGAYAAGMTVTWIPSNTNTGNSTVNLNGAGAKALVKAGTTGPVQLSPGDVIAGVAATAVYDGTRFQLLSPATAVTSSAGASSIFCGIHGIYSVGLVMATGIPFFPALAIGTTSSGGGIQTAPIQITGAPTAIVGFGAQRVGTAAITGSLGNYTATMTNNPFTANFGSNFTLFHR